MRAKNSFFKIKNEAEKAEVFIYDRIGEGNWFEADGISSKEFNEAIAAIPEDKEILLRINSPGGSVWEGFAIYNYLKQHRARLTCVVDGVCASIATIIACAARTVTMNDGSAYFIHKPTGYARGNAEEIKKAAEALDLIENNLVGVYADKTGLSTDKIKELLEDSTWMDGPAALALGFIDDVSEEKSTQAFNIKEFAAMLKDNKSFNFWLSRNGGPDEGTINMSTVKKNPEPTPSNPIEGEDVAKGQNQMTLNKEEYDAFLAAKNELDAIKRKEAQKKQEEITNMVNELVQSGKVNNKYKSMLITNAMNDETQLKFVQDMVVQNRKAAEVNPPQIERVDEVLSDVRKIEEYRNRLTRQKNFFERGQFIRKHSAVIREAMIRDDNRRLYGAQNYDNGGLDVSAGLKRDYITGFSLDAYSKVMVDLREIFTIVPNPMPLEGTNKVRVPYFPLANLEVRDFLYRGKGTGNGNDEGYIVDGGYKPTDREVEVNIRKYLGINYTSEQLARTPIITLERVYAEAGKNLGYNMWRTLCGYITVLNYTQVYPVNALGIKLNKWNLDAVIDLKTMVDNLQWPEGNRKLVMNTAYANELLKSRILQTVGSTSTAIITDGDIDRLTKFKLITAVNLPDNSENLVGFATQSDSLLVVNAPIKPAQLTCSYETYTDPSTGLVLEARGWDDNKMDERNWTLEVNFGAAVVFPEGLVRITQPAG